MSRHDPFAELLDGARAEDAATARNRERWLRRQAQEGAHLAGTLVDLAEEGVVVTLQTVAGRTHIGALTAVGIDFVGLHAGDGSTLLVALDAVAFVRFPVSSGTRPRPAAGQRPPPLDRRLVEILFELAAERARVVLVARGEPHPLVGELCSTGVDVATVALDPDGRAVCHVALQSLTEVAVRTSG